MSSLETLYRSLLLPAVSVFGLAATRAQSNTPASTTEPEPEPDRERDAIRVRNLVRVITGIEEGCPLDRLPGGVYGFSYSPASDSVPLFAKRSLASFEIHKTAGASVQILGYVTGKESEAFAGGDPQDIQLYPEVYQGADHLIAIPADRIVRAKGPSRRDGNYLTMAVK